ncbi:MAG: UDP-galactopyranose mutase [Paludibacteraceae bacterium]|nr:UDP-galactopyranose mutase [Paludibacteraceae bacterium]
MQHYDYLIVGAGLFGATFAYLAKQAGKTCLVIDKRPHVGGNVYCEEREGIHVHSYGAHIFHTSDKTIWDFVNSLVPFNRYTNSPIANYKGELYNLPFNMNTFRQIWGVQTPDEALRKVKDERLKVKGEIGDREPRNLEEQALMLVGRDIYEKLIKGYTEKQWGRDCSQLPASIIRRLPLRFVYDNNYFNDLYQGIPVGGYNRLIERLLEGIDTRVNCDFFADRAELTALADKIVYTGPIDQFYDYRFGRLEYRTVRFETEVLDTPNYQGNAVINFTDRETPYTRIIEHKHFETFGEAVYENPRTIISREYPLEWQKGLEPYYPINDERNTALYARYKALAETEKNILFGGRLAEYKYYDMAPTLTQAIRLAKESI